MRSTKSTHSAELENRALPDSASALDNCLGFALRRAQLTMFQDLMGDLSSFDMRPAQFSALVLIESNPGISQRDLAQALECEPPQLVMMLNRLEGQQLALRVRNKADRRSHGVFLTKAGEILLRQLKSLAMESHERSTAHLSTDEYNQLLGLLRKIYLKPSAA